MSMEGSHAPRVTAVSLRATEITLYEAETSRLSIYKVGEQYLSSVPVFVPHAYLSSNGK